MDSGFLPDKEFEVRVIRVLNEYCTYMKREVETISKNQLEVKNDIAET